MTRIQRINEIARKQFLGAADPTFIHHAQYTKDLPKENETGAQYFKTDTIRVKGKRLFEVKFRTRSSEKTEVYIQKIILRALDELIKSKRSNMTLRQKVSYSVNKGDLQIYCPCDAFLYWGYQYINTTMDSIHPRHKILIPPDERNPQRRGIICKHLGLVLNVLPFNISKITSDVQNILQR